MIEKQRTTTTKKENRKQTKLTSGEFTGQTISGGKGKNEEKYTILKLSDHILTGSYNDRYVQYTYLPVLCTCIFTQSKSQTKKAPVLHTYLFVQVGFRLCSNQGTTY